MGRHWENCTSWVCKIYIFWCIDVNTSLHAHTSTTYLIGLWKTLKDLRQCICLLLKTPGKTVKCSRHFPFLTLNTNKPVISLKWKSIFSRQWGGLSDPPAETILLFTWRGLWHPYLKGATLAGGNANAPKIASRSITPRSCRLGTWSLGVCARLDQKTLRRPRFPLKEWTTECLNLQQTQRNRFRAPGTCGVFHPFISPGIAADGAPPSPERGSRSPGSRSHPCQGQRGATTDISQSPPHACCQMAALTALT